MSSSLMFLFFESASFMHAKTNGGVVVENRQPVCNRTKRETKNQNLTKHEKNN